MAKEAQPITLFNDTKQCCGCAACKDICPKKAIHMRRNRFGFVYPVIDEAKCIRCKQCRAACAFQNGYASQPVKATYAAAAVDTETLQKSASGGIFASLAQAILAQGGTVFGAALQPQGDTLEPKMIGIRDKVELHRLQGSKYVQCSMEGTYLEVKAELEKQRNVLFSGTPCQVAGLKAFLGKDEKNLYTVDMICHGVPSAELFQDYLAWYRQTKKKTVIDFQFRDKTYGWGLIARISCLKKKGKRRDRVIPAGASSYYDLFLKAESYRDSCYTCPYASGYRAGDVTLGDYWGIQQVHPEWLVAAGGPYDVQKGVSCMLINTEQGEKLLALGRERIHFCLSDLKDVARENGQLAHPTVLPLSRAKVLEIYARQGYQGVERYYRKRSGLRPYYLLLKLKMPTALKSALKNCKAILRRA